MMNKAFNSKYKYKRGFTVLESIVAIFVLSLSISGVFSAVQQGLSQNIIAKDEVKAFYLAQEAIEIIRNKRDLNQIAKLNIDPTRDWLYQIAGNSAYPCDFNKVCRADIYDSSLTRCGDNWDTCPKLRQNPTSYVYSYYNSSWPETNFTREIKIEQINSNEVAITVRISWTKGGLLPFSFKTKVHLLNWI